MGSVAGQGVVAGIRRASMAEDPANRRSIGSGPNRLGIYLFPMVQPEIVSLGGGPAIVHSADFSPVTAMNPARPGEILSLLAIGLGPTVPGVEPGQAFPADPIALVNSPVEVTINDKTAEVLFAGGYPGSIDRYQVNFCVPESATGIVMLRISSAWIRSKAVPIMVRPAMP